MKARLDAIERELAAARTAALIKSGGHFPADQADRMAARGRQIAGPFPVPAPAEIRRTPFPVPAPSEIRGGPIAAVVQNPVPVAVSGNADVTVKVEVSASPELKAIATEARRASMQLRSAPTGRSMPEAEPPRGGVGASGSW